MRINRFHVASYVFFMLAAFMWLIAACLFISNAGVIGFCCAYVVVKVFWEAMETATAKAIALDPQTKSPDS